MNDSPAIRQPAALDRWPPAASDAASVRG